MTCNLTAHNPMRQACVREYVSADAEAVASQMNNENISVPEPKLFSIITPTFNCGRKIEKTIESVLSQNTELFEYIIVDGASSDDTLQIIEGHADDLRLISERDAGAYDAMNKGIDAASGKYLYFLGAGDSLRTDALQNIAAMMPDDLRALVYGNVYWVDKNIIYDGEFSNAKLKTYHNLCHQSVFYGRSVFDLIGKYDPRFDVLADYAFNIKCFGDERIKKKYIGYVIANFEGGGISTHRRDFNFMDEYPELIERYLAGE